MDPAVFQRLFKVSILQLSIAFDTFIEVVWYCLWSRFKVQTPFVLFFNPLQIRGLCFQFPALPLSPSETISSGHVFLFEKMPKCWKCFPVIKSLFYGAACSCLEWRVKPRGLQSSKFNELGLHMAADQVLSQTQFYTVGFSQSRVSVKRAIVTDTQSRFVSVVFDGIFGPPPLVPHTFQCLFITEIIEATHNARLRPLKDAHISSKSLSKVQKYWRNKLLEGTNEKNSSPDEGSLVYLLTIFYIKWMKKMS